MIVDTQSTVQVNHHVGDQWFETSSVDIGLDRVSDIHPDTVVDSITVIIDLQRDGCKTCSTTGGRCDTVIVKSRTTECPEVLRGGKKTMRHGVLAIKQLYPFKGCHDSAAGIKSGKEQVLVIGGIVGFVDSTLYIISQIGGVVEAIVDRSIWLQCPDVQRAATGNELHRHPSQNRHDR